MKDLMFADYAVIAGFFMIMITIGLYFRKRMVSTLDFFGGGEKVPWWLGGISFYMCSFSATAFVMYSALAYRYGFVAVTIYWVTVPSTLIGACFFATRWRRVAETSPLEYIEHRFGNVMRQSLVWLGIPARMFDDGLKLFAIGTVVSVAVGDSFPLETAIIISGLIMMSYTFFGGLWAALVADFVQFTIMLAGVILLPFLLLYRVGGIDAFVSQAPEGFFALTTARYTWGYIAVFLIVIALQYNTAWSLVQRYYSSDSDKNARKVGYLVSFLNLISPVIFFLPAMIARVVLPEIENPNHVYAIVCKSVLPVGMLGMIIAAMFSATMSTVAGDFNAIASVLTNDFYKRMLAPQSSARAQMIMARVNTLIIGLGTIVVAFIIQKAQGTGDLFQVLVKFLALFMPPIAIPMLLGLHTKKISNAGGLLGLWFGIAIGLVLFIVNHFYPDQLNFLPSLQSEQVIALLVCVATTSGIIFGTHLWPGGEATRERITEFIKTTNAKDWVQTSEEKDQLGQFSPFTIIGVAIMNIGVILIAAVVFTAPEKSILAIGIGVAMVLIGLTFRLATKTSNKNTPSSF